MRWSHLAGKYNRQLGIAAFLFLFLPFFPHIGIETGSGSDLSIRELRWFSLFGIAIHSGLWAILLLMPLMTGLVTKIEEGTARRSDNILLRGIIIAVSIILLFQGDLPMYVFSHCDIAPSV